VALRAPPAAAAGSVRARCLKRSSAGGGVLAALREHQPVTVRVAQDRLRPARHLPGGM
jgi:hypothetical protein